MEYYTEFFTQKGIAIKAIDKTDGIITTENTSFMNAYTWENLEHQLMNPAACVVCAKYKSWMAIGPSFLPQSVTGQWIVHVYEQNNKTVV
ncbi:hypothetical protein [Hydrotalea sp.]|uniref:hypothetical protein n=1 Tax=Hydrotalea sp. TaxID=2881279 RepID=UPI002602E671|nr:hypothetical protein [Hydrotalea sp.]